MTSTGEGIIISTKKNIYESNFGILQPVKRENKKIRKKIATAKNNKEEDEETDKIFSKQKQYVEVYEDVQKLREYMYEDYMERLEAVLQQRRNEIRWKSEQKQRQLEEKEMKQRKASHSVKQRLERHKLVHDKHYLSHVPKSNMYNLITLYDKKIADGSLKFQFDRDLFWLSRGQHIGRKSVRPPTGAKPTSELVDEQPSLRMKRSLMQIEELRESRNTGRSEPAGALQSGKQGTKFITDPSYIARQAAADLDSQYPELNIPNLYCFTDELDDKPRDPKEVLAEIEAKQHEEQRQRYVRRIRKMHDLAQSNRANMIRMFNKHDRDFDLCLEGAKLHELIAVDNYLQPTEDYESQRNSFENFAINPFVQTRNNTFTSIQSSNAVSKSKAEKKLELALFKAATSENLRQLETAQNFPEKQTTDEVVIAPLQTDDLLEHYKQMDASCLSTLWSNYLQIGSKSNK